MKPQRNRIFQSFRLLKLPALFLIIFLTISCSKDKGSGVNVTSGKMSATIDGKKYTLDINNIKKSVSGDTTSIILEGMSSDSTVSIGLYFEQIVGFKATTYYCGLLSDSTGGFVQANYFNTKNDSSYICDGIGSKGSINIITYSSQVIQGSFNFDAKNPGDSLKTVKISGEFNCSINDFLNGTDLPIIMGKMWAQPDNGSTYFNVVAGKISKGSDHEIIVTGSSKNQSIVIDFLNFTPKINVEYNIGKFDTSSIAKLTASYITEDQKIFYADGTNGSTGTVKIAKFTSGNIQGVFQFTGVNTLNSSERSVIRNGMFNAKLKNY